LQDWWGNRHLKWDIIDIHTVVIMRVRLRNRIAHIVVALRIHLLGDTVEQVRQVTA
jgi:hypothetical protein